MPHILLIQDGGCATLTVQQALSVSGISCSCLDLEEFQPEYLLSEAFDLIIFEISGENRACVVILQRLEMWSAVSGMEHPPVIVVTDMTSDTIEQAIRTSKVNFYFVKPLAGEELASAIEQSFLPHAPLV
jgi:DNA-binding response OmpR family regulator